MIKDGFYFGGPAIGGDGVGLIVLIAILIYFFGSGRSRPQRRSQDDHGGANHFDQP